MYNVHVRSFVVKNPQCLKLKFFLFTCIVHVVPSYWENWRLLLTSVNFIVLSMVHTLYCIIAALFICFLTGNSIQPSDEEESSSEDDGIIDKVYRLCLHLLSTRNFFLFFNGFI